MFLNHVLFEILLTLSRGKLCPNMMSCSCSLVPGCEGLIRVECKKVCEHLRSNVVDENKVFYSHGSLVTDLIDLIPVCQQLLTFVMRTIEEG